MNRRDQHKKPQKRRSEDRDPNAPYWMYGTHPVRAALDNQARKTHRLIGTRNALNNLGDVAMETELVERKAIDHLVGRDAVHQGLALEVSPLASPTLADIAHGGGTLVVLDQVTDPHNVGAVMRSAAAFGANAILTTWRHSPPETAVLAKTSAGALELVPYIRERNLAECLQSLKDMGYIVVGLDGQAEATPTDLPALDNVALVLGAEGKGLRQRTSELCDHLIRLPISEKVDSLNVSNAAAVALYALAQK